MQEGVAEISCTSLMPLLLMREHLQTRARVSPVGNDGCSGKDGDCLVILRG